MELFINEEPVSFSLEKENSLLELFTALCGWAAEHGSRLTGFEVNGASMDLAKSGDWGTRSLDGVTEIRVQAAATQQVEELEIICGYFELFGKALEEGSDETLWELLVEYPHIRRGLEAYIGDLFRPEEISVAEQLILAPWEKGQAFSAAEKNAFSAFVRSAGHIVRDRLDEILDPRKESAATARLLTAAKSTLENAPVLLQSGKDNEAMQNILTYTELALKALRLLAGRSRREEAAEEFCRDLGTVFGELMSAFEAKDSVLIGDLLEYEIAPRTDKLVELLGVYP